MRARHVAPPWERELYSYRPVRVEREGSVEPERGPVECYRATWPWRYVVWNPERQMFEIRQRNPLTGHDERVELVYELVDPPDEVAEERLRAIAEVWRAAGKMPDTKDGGWDEEDDWLLLPRELAVEKVFRPFDYEFVLRRKRERMEFLELGSEGYERKLQAQEEAIQRSRVRDWAREGAAAIGEVRRYIPTVGGEPKIPLVAVGIDLRGGR